LLLITTCRCASAGAAEKPKVGITEFRVAGDLDPSLEDSLYDTLLNNVADTGRAIVVGREEIGREVKDIKESRQATSEEEARSKAISNLGIEKMCAGSLAKVGNRYYASVKVVNLDLSVERVITNSTESEADLETIISDLAIGVVLTRTELDHFERAEEAWAKAEAENTEQAYREYLEDFPESRRAAEAAAGLEQRTLPFKLEMVLIKGGAFTMGSKQAEVGRDHDEGPASEVAVGDFYLGKYEVTFAQYDAFCDATSRKKPDDEGWGRGDRPAIRVTWNAAAEFCNWLSEVTKLDYRLPTEAEWEYACRAGTTTPFYWGESLENVHEHANTVDQSAKRNHPDWSAIPGDDGYAETAPVGTYKPNAWGLYDMHGNVWEWCADWYDVGYYRYGPESNPQGPAEGTERVLRGGSWFNSLPYLRSASRQGFNPDYVSNGVGFRVARSP
jgi:formylglycine-generating enzyme required for sulfatase activity